jgi:hypothetical protein
VGIAALVLAVFVLLFGDNICMQLTGQPFCGIVRPEDEATLTTTEAAYQDESVSPASTTIVASTSDPRDIAAQILGYSDLDAFMQAFEVPIEVKPRVFVCPREETWCLAVFEEPGQPDFHFRNITECALDGKQADGVSGIPVGFDGMVKGFTVRPCSR